MDIYLITIAIISIIAYIAMINLIYFLAPTKIMNDFPKKCSQNLQNCKKIQNQTDSQKISQISKTFSIIFHSKVSVRSSKVLVRV